LAENWESMSERTFESARLRLARELRGWSQAELARQLAVTPAAISQFESGATKPSAETCEQLGRRLGVPVGFFSLALTEIHEGFFRSLRRTAVADRRKARAVAHIAHDLATHDSALNVIPRASIPEFPISVSAEIGEVEEVAAQVRRQWQVIPGPVPEMVELIERHGAAVIRLPLGSADVDAFSLPFDDRPVIVLGSDKNDRARSRFDTSHELGHLVMHGQRLYGLPEVERQAHWFAAAFLMPRDDIYNELPRRVDWPILFDLKQKWKVSLAALLMRARTLGALSESNYLTAIKTASARGWRRVEPVPLGAPERPRMLNSLMTSSAGQKARISLPHHILDALAAAIP
jgi:Zn-dependent peptidase ImmA (M78 family)/DNA-binding XRE family transcriptional regulator